MSSVPSLLRFVLNHNEMIYKNGVNEGMAKARDISHLPGTPAVSRWTTAYKYHLMVCRAYNNGQEDLVDVAFSQGFVAGWTAITSNTIA